MSIARTLRLLETPNFLPPLRQELNSLSPEERLAKINEPDIFGDTPLHIAAASGVLLLVKYLVSQGADVNARNKAGSTPLHKAMLGGKIPIVEFLLENKAEWVANDSGYTPFTYARDILRENKQFFFTLLSKETKNIAKETIRIPSNAIRIIIGKEGKMLETLRATTQTNVDVPAKIKDSIQTEEVELYLTARNQEYIDNAKKRIEELIKKQEDEANKKEQKEQKPQKEVEEFKTKKEVKKRPDAKPEEKNITTIVNDIALNKAPKQEIMKEFTVPIPKDKHGLVIGKEGANLTRLQNKYGVTVIIPHRSDPKDIITLRGPNKESLNDAKYDIFQTLRDPRGAGRGRGRGGQGGQDGSGRQDGPRQDGSGRQGRPKRDRDEEKEPKPDPVKPKLPQKIGNLNDPNQYPALG